MDENAARIFSPLHGHCLASCNRIHRASSRLGNEWALGKCRTSAGYKFFRVQPPKWAPFSPGEVIVVCRSTVKLGGFWVPSGDWQPEVRQKWEGNCSLAQI